MEKPSMKSLKNEISQAILDDNIDLVQNLLKDLVSPYDYPDHKEACYELLCTSITTLNTHISELLIRMGAPVNMEGACKDTPLHLAAKYNDLHITKVLLKKGADVNAQDYLGRTALHLTAEKNTMYVARILLKYGARLNVTLTYNDYTPLHVAVKNKNTEMVKFLLHHKAEVNMNENSQGPVHVAVHNDNWDAVICKELLLSGANINAPNSEGKTPLFIAVESNCYEATSFLLEHGADVKTTSAICMKTLLHVAIENKNLPIIEILVKYKADVNAASQHGKTPLHVALGTMDMNIIVHLLKNNADLNFKMKMPPRTRSFYVNNEMMTDDEDEATNNDCERSTPLFWAIKYGTPELVRKFLVFKGDVNAENEKGITALHFAVQHERAEMVKLILNFKPNIENEERQKTLSSAINGIVKNRSDHQTIIISLFQYGLSLGPQDPNHEELFSRAISLEYDKLSDHILKKGNISFEMKQKALFDTLKISSTIYYSNSYKYPVVNVLICNGVDINALDENGKSPLYYAVKYSHPKCAILLLKEKANIIESLELLKFAFTNQCKPIIDTLVQYGAPLQAIIDQDGANLILNASKNGRYALVNMLLEKGAPVNARSVDGMTPLHMAAKTCIRTVKLLLEHGVDVNAVDIRGNTALHMIASVTIRINTAESIVKDPNVKVDIKNANGETPLHIAVRSYHIHMMKLLLDVGANLEFKDSHGNTPLHLAIKSFKPALIKILIDFTPNIDTNKTTLDLPLTPPNYNLEHSIGRVHLKMIYTLILLLHNHLLKRKWANLTVCVDTRTKVESLLPDPSIYNAFEDRDFLLDKSSYVSEAERMTQVMIGSSNVSYHALLMKNTNQIASLLKNKIIARELASQKYKGQFPYYADMITGSYNCAKSMRRMLDDFDNHYHKVFPQLSYYCVQQILVYLDSNDLLALLTSLKI